MKKEQLLGTARDPHFIPGIHKYCDRWCERCEFTQRCLNYASLDEDDNSHGSKTEINGVEFSDKTSKRLALAIALLKDVARKRGVDLDAIDTVDVSGEEEAKHSEADSHELAVMSMEYAQSTGRWFKANDQLFARKREELLRAAALDLPGANPEEQASDLKESIEVVRWYQFQIHVKLLRALMADDFDALDDGPSDADGSAKVALIGVDRSLAAWSVLLAYFPEAQDDILDFPAALERIRRITERTFPGARSFVRPGFDTQDASWAESAELFGIDETRPMT
ncbi:MAG: hypothetical protein E4H02_04415 [Lentisphaerales bacterium]|nr:MAG: hypothetical protein E4H02_04415 [Lentisphaerales bacterium]